MRKCLYNGVEIFADEAYEIFENEEEIRAAAKSNKLFCPWEECGMNVEFRKGEIRRAYFAHKKSGVKCEYDKFHKQRDTSEVLEKAIKSLYELLLQNKNLTVKRDCKIIDHNWADIVVSDGNGNVIAFDCIEKYISQSAITRKINRYLNEGKQYQIIILKSVSSSQDEKNWYYYKRKALHSDNVLLEYDIENNELYGYQKHYNEVVRIKIGVSSFVFQNGVFCNSDFEKQLAQCKNSAYANRVKSPHTYDNVGVDVRIDSSLYVPMKMDKSMDMPNVLSVEEIKILWANDAFVSAADGRRKIAHDKINNGWKYNEETRENIIIAYRELRAENSCAILKIDNQFTHISYEISSIDKIRCK
ncbi:MAG: hypothetical protein R3Y45_02230 [Bacillota bacterium]